ncbi:MAG: hypothetical protein WA061_02055 [Microgenomates group bacterium]
MLQKVKILKECYNHGQIGTIVETFPARLFLEQEVIKVELKVGVGYFTWDEVELVF